jgi:hypothetical protein
MDAATDVQFVVRQGLSNVFFDISDPAAPELVAPQQPIVGDWLFWASSVTIPSALSSAIAERGETLDFVGHGVVYTIVADCVGGVADFGSASPHTTITVSKGSKAYYGTDPAAAGGGTAWFINVPGDSTTVEVFHDGVLQQSGRVPVRAGTITVATFNYPLW